MPKLIITIVTVILLIIVLAVLSNRLPSISEVNVEYTSEPFSELELESDSWKATLQQVPAYFKPPEEEKEEVPSTDTSPPAPPRQPNEARLMAVVNFDEDELASAVFFLLDTNQTKSLKIGEGWLSEWKLKEIKADYVVWNHIEDNREIKQALF